uniref:Uncharacterized protein n=1 Tax=Melopsittacus undulatus TaxID=13146 RepID=A0A8V5GP16_MELUD
MQHMLSCIPSMSCTSLACCSSPPASPGLCMPMSTLAASDQGLYFARSCTNPKHFPVSWPYSRTGDGYCQALGSPDTEGPVAAPSQPKEGWELIGACNHSSPLPPSTGRATARLRAELTLTSG